ncbi:deoxyribonuclease-1 isoform X3 [Talpa occidentalis]|uniref:deoxyribonuclease-1 isoform X3 n=1 Tax=Talpa occidentalis TaxID=50954 RepID=UPI00188EE62A|nr:deoxyribonuclease-1 isoform X3 [Talpa occidentalis]
MVATEVAAAPTPSWHPSPAGAASSVCPETPAAARSPAALTGWARRQVGPGQWSPMAPSAKGTSGSGSRSFSVLQRTCSPALGAQHVRGAREPRALSGVSKPGARAVRCAFAAAVTRGWSRRARPTWRSPTGRATVLSHRVPPRVTGAQTFKTPGGWHSRARARAAAASPFGFLVHLPQGLSAAQQERSGTEDNGSVWGSRVRMRGAKLTGALLALAGLLHVALSLKIAAFNIRTFGETKMSNATLATYIVRILSRYDIAVIQEVRDSHLQAVGKLLDGLNQDAPDSFHYVASEPLGRGTYKERYVFVFRPERVSVRASYLYDDGCEPCGNDTFSREPAVVRFSSPRTRVTDFAIAPLHAAPMDAVPEIDALYDVYLDIRKKWGLENILFMGDFNAGCAYVSPAQWPSIRLRASPAFQWLIPDSADTTVTTTRCPYDRCAGRPLPSSGPPAREAAWGSRFWGQPLAG